MSLVHKRLHQVCVKGIGPQRECKFQALVGHVAEHMALSYPLGFTTASSDVDAFLGREGSEKLKIPQMVVIDRKGVIRATTGDGADTRMEDETALRTLVNSLLDDTAASSAAKTKGQR
jgi:hypothetical protein